MPLQPQVTLNRLAFHLPAIPCFHYHYYYYSYYSLEERPAQLVTLTGGVVETPIHFHFIKQTENELEDVALIVFQLPGHKRERESHES